MAALINFLFGIVKSILRMFLMRKVSSRLNRGPAQPLTVEKIDGLEYLLGAARSSIELPHVRAFREMLISEEITSGAHADTSAKTEDIEELSERTLAALAVVTVAAQSAARRGDLEGMKEVLHLGLKCALTLENAP